MKILFSLVTAAVLIVVTSCGKKGNLEYPKDAKRPSFENVTDEN